MSAPASAPTSFELPKVEWTLSNLQFLAWGGASLALGVALIKSPADTISFLSPATKYIETLVPGVPALQVRGSEQLLALAGALHVLLGFYAVMSVYTCDEKAKRNSVPGRFAFGLACLYICQKTPHGSSLVAFFGVCSAVSGILMALLVGPGDGNAVDLEEGERKWRAAQRTKAKATAQTSQ